MQSLQQQQLLSKQDSPQFGFADCNHHGVSDFLDHCHLNQYLDIFLSEGFDSVTSVKIRSEKKNLLDVYSNLFYLQLLEITEEDMIFMGVKRGHRRVSIELYHQHLEHLLTIFLFIIVDSKRNCYC
jgi:hypothetical protein